LTPGLALALTAGVKKLLFLALAGALAACTAAAPVTSGKSHGHKSTSTHASGDDDDDNTQSSDLDGPSGSTSTAPTEPDPVVDTRELDPFFAAQMKAANIPGIGIAVVRDGHLKWTKGYGLADIAAKKPVGRDTLFMLASVSKTITTVALMQLIEDPKNGVSLDDDVSTKAGFTVRNPRFTSTKITYRMLLTHTSSLIDGPSYFDAPYAKGDSPTPLEQFEKEAIADPDRWQTTAPGQQFEYSNTAIALAGLLAEKISGQNLQTYAKSHIFDPLGMKETSYFFKGLDPSHIAQPYNGPNLEPQGFYGYPDYPSGQIRTSAPQLARFLEMFSEGGALGNVRILKAETAQQMMTIQLPEVAPAQGLTFYFDDTKATSKDLLGHEGADKGVSTQMFFDPKTKAGYVLLMNARDQLDDTDAVDQAIGNMTNKLMELAVTLP
jgi:CubicO group peptidase (beta-lactamase class C family)